MKKRGRKLILLFLMLLVFLSGCGKKGDGIYDFEGQDPQVIDPWVYLKDNSISQDTILRDFASSAAQLGITVGILGMVFSILLMAIRLASSSDPKKREEIKQEAIIKAIIGILLFSIPFWMGVLKLFGDSLIT